MRILNGLLAAAAACLLSSPALANDETPIPPDHYTKAELTSFKSTPGDEEVTAFLDRLVKTSPYLHVETFGRTGQGRAMRVVVASKDKALTPEAAAKNGKPRVLVINSIHGGEVDGTDASLILLRDIALGNRAEILDGVTLLVVPIYNVDGHERVSKYNRPNQDGPVMGMGFRTSARGYDLNRDWLKADAPETRALLALSNAWKPDLFVDDHVTDGADFQPTLTLAYGAEPWTAKPLADWLESVVPPALKDVEESGFKTAPYIDWVDPMDPAKGTDLAVTPPRYSTGYFPLRGVPAILVETHSIKPYADRVRANERFLRALLTRTAKTAKALLSAREAALTSARKASAGSPFAVDVETDRSRSETIELSAYAWNRAISPVTGKPVIRFDRQHPIPLPLPVYRHVKPTVTVPRPAGYLVPAGWPEIEERLKAHGLAYRKLEKPETLEVGTYRVESAAPAKDTYQGWTRLTAKIRRGGERLTLPAGSLYVPLDTELAPVAMHLLEPESPDSLFAWGQLSAALEQKEYIDLRVLDPLAEEMLAKDPKLKAEWEEKLKDPAFAGDPLARYRFFYTRTPYWDATVGLVPVFRLDKPL